MQFRLGLTYGQDHDPVCIFRSSLAIGVKVAHGIQLFAEKFSPERPVCCRGKHIQDSTPDGKLTGALHHGAAAVAAAGEPLSQSGDIVFMAYFQRKGGVFQYLRRHGTLAHGFPGHNLEPGCPGAQIIKQPQPLLLPCPGHHGGIIQRQLPGGKYRNSFSKKGAEFFLQPLGGHVVLADYHNGRRGILPQTGNQMGTVDLPDACDSGAFSPGNSGKQSRIFRERIQNRKQCVHNFLHATMRKGGKYPPFRGVLTIYYG